MTISCSRCGLAFESQATTATRCPSCRAVVHISRRPAVARVRSSPSVSVSHGAYAAETDDSVWNELLVLAGAIAVGYLAYRLIRRAWERRHGRAEDDQTPSEETSGEGA